MLPSCTSCSGLPHKLEGKIKLWHITPADLSSGGPSYLSHPSREGLATRHANICVWTVTYLEKAARAYGLRNCDVPATFGSVSWLYVSFLFSCGQNLDWAYRCFGSHQGLSIHKQRHQPGMSLVSRSRKCGCE